MIRVLHIIDHLGPGGAQTALLNLLQRRDATRFDYTVASMHGQGATAPEFSALGVRVLSLSPVKMPPYYLLTLPRLLKAGKFDVVHFHLFGANWIAKPFARLLGARVLFNHDQCNDAMRENYGWLAVDWLTNLFSTRILAVSRSTVDFLRKREKIASARLEYFPNGVDVQSFHPATPEERAAARQKWGLPAEGLLIGGVGRLAPQKDFPTFLVAAARLRTRWPDAHFVIFGEGPDDVALKEQAERLGITVHFPGYVRDRHAIYQALDVLFLTSKYEGTPLVILEAMAASVPVCASAVDGVAEVLTSGENASLFPPRNPEAAAEALGALLENPQQRTRQAANARQQVERHFDVVEQMRRLERFYEQALENKRGAGGR
jgi:glycosyltransferase involved in cell wall biosynthesis